MSDEGVSETVGAEQEQTLQGRITAGSMLRSAREAAGLHVAALAVSMKIPVKKLEALEADRLDLLHDAVFVRALAASVCRALKIDSEPILSKLPLNSTPKLNPDERGINAPFRSANDATGIAISQLLKKPSTLIVLVLVAAGVGVYFVPEIKLPNWVAELSGESTKSTDFVNLPQEAQPTGVVMETGREPVTEPTTTVGVPNSLSLASAATEAGSPVSAMATSFEKPSTNALAPVVVPVVVPAVAASLTSSAPVLPSTGTIVFKAKGSTWVKVVDAKGVVQLSKTIVDGEVVGASGAAPLTVVIGRVDVTDVEVRGKPFVLTGVSKDNVARFEVK